MLATSRVRLFLRSYSLLTLATKYTLDLISNWAENTLIHNQKISIQVEFNADRKAYFNLHLNLGIVNWEKGRERPVEDRFAWHERQHLGKPSKLNCVPEEFSTDRQRVVRAMGKGSYMYEANGFLCWVLCLSMQLFIICSSVSLPFSFQLSSSWH